MSEGNWTLKPEDLRWVDESPKSGMIVGDMSPKVVVEHVPTGVIVRVDRHRRPHKNRDEALSILDKNTHRHQYKNREVALSRSGEKIKEIDYV